MKKAIKIFSLILALSMTLLSVASCADPAEPSKSEEPEHTEAPVETTEDADPETETTEEATLDPDGTHTVTDHAGNEVTVPNTVNRVVVCDIYPLPSIISVFFNSADKIVGMAKQSMAAAKNSLLGELYPEILQAETGFIDGTTVNMEELLKLDPDVVIYNAGNKALGEQLRNANLAAVAFSAGKWQYDSLETLNQWILTLSEVFGEKSAVYDKVKAYGEDALSRVTERVSTIEEKEDVFFLFQYTAESMLSAGNPSFGSRWAEAIGANFVVKEKTEANSLAVNMEQVYAWNPSVIFVTNFTTASAEDIRNSTIGSYNWSAVEAVKNGRVYKMPLGMYRSYTSGVDSPITLLWLAKACYPDAFTDVDITAETKAYYKDVFGVDLTDEQANSIFDPDPNAGKMN